MSKMDCRPFANTGAKGAWAELLVAADLLRWGVEVFRACSPSADHPCCAWWLTQPEWASEGCVACRESRKARRRRTW